MITDAATPAPPAPPHHQTPRSEDPQSTTQRPWTAVDLIIEHGLKFLLDFLGITDIVNCFTKGDIGACVSAAAGMVPATKIFSMAGKIGKGIWKAFKAWKAWKAATKWADNVIEKIGAKLAKGRRDCRRVFVHPQF